MAAGGVLALFASLAPSPATSTDARPGGDAELRLASTIGPVEAGIVPALEDAFREKTGIAMRHVAAGTGEALRMAAQGGFDLVLVHARALEEKFVAEGHGTARYDLMYNDFVILGPPADPARIGGEGSAAAAVKRIAAAKAPFVTRGDRSGTHVKELDVWKAAGVQPEGAWYEVYEKGSEGNAKTLKHADARQAYVLMDRATYVTLKDALRLKVLVQRDPLLLNHMTLIPVNPARFPDVKHAEAMRFVEFATSADGQQLIRDFGKEKYGEPLFFPNSPVGRSLPPAGEAARPKAR
jgi:tungstate transport system substrate-binding protein